jgi:hypothetical protein
MIKYILNRICLVVFPFILCACSKQFVFLTYQDPNYTLARLPESTITFYVSDEPVVREFKKSFRDRYGSGEEFAAEMARALVVNSHQTFGRGRAKTGPSNIVRSSSPKSADANPMAKFSSALERDAADVSIVIRDIVISNSYQYSSGPMISVGGGGMRVGGGSSTENCIVGFKVEIWENRSKHKLLEAEIQGECSVTFFAYKTALAGAVSNSLDHLMAFLKDGKTAF